MRRNAARRAPSAGDLHRAWLELVDTDGPFLAVPALVRVWPHGIPQPDPDAVAALREAKPAFEKAWEDWDRRRDDTATVDRLPRGAGQVGGGRAARRPGLGRRRTARRRTAVVRSPDHAVTVRRDGRPRPGRRRRRAGARRRSGRLACVIRSTDGWATSPIDRMEELLRAAAAPIGVVTDGRWWAIVSARPETMVASGIVDAQTWVEEPPTRNAFVELLQPPTPARRPAGGPADRDVPASRSPPPRRSPRRSACRSAGRSSCWCRRCRRRRWTRVGRGEPDPLPADAAAGLRGGRDGDDAGGVPAVRRGARPAAAGPAVRRGLRHQRRAGRARRPGARRRAARPSTPRT